MVVSSLVGLALTIAQPSPILACVAASDVLIDVAATTSRPKILATIDNPQRVKSMVGLYGLHLLSKSFSQAAYVADGSGGWMTFLKDGSATGVAPPHAQMIFAFMHSKVLDAASTCPNLKAEVQRIGWTTDTKHTSKDESALKNTSVSLTLPVISSSGLEAMMWVDLVSGHNAASGGLVLLRRTLAGKWRVAGRFPIYVT